MKWLSIVGLFLWWASVVRAANILAILPMPSVSHHRFYEVFVKELLKKGHNLTLVSPNPIQDPSMTNLREIDLSYGYNYMKESMDVSSSSKKWVRMLPEILLVLYWKIVNDLCHLFLSDPNLMELFHKNEKFDVVFTEWGILRCVYPFEKLSGGKIIGISSFESGSYVQNQLGCPINPAHLSDLSLEYSDRMTFPQRLRSTAFFLIITAFMKILSWKETKIAREYFGQDIPNLIDIEKKVALVFDNSHVTTSYPRPQALNLVPLGGAPFHLNGKRLQDLPKDIKDFMDGAQFGVIYFSLGTNVKTNNMSVKEEEILLKSFSKMKQRILWKWENENLKVNLKHVMKAKWFPQIEVLAHPKMKAFVTQGGLQSIGEAIEYRVPMIVMPFFADQNHNARKMEAVGVAKVLDFDNLTEEDFTGALNDIIYNKTYKENAIKFSELVRDQPIPPLEKAVWWTEYVIRHNGAPHLRSIAATMPWYQYLNLDVFFAVIIIILFFIYLLYFILKTIFRLILGSKKAKKD